MMDNCKTCVFHGQWCEKENKCPLFKEFTEHTENESENENAMKKESEAGQWKILI